MSKDFSFSDLGRVHWGSTIKLALARGLIAGIIWTVLTSSASGPNTPPGPSPLVMPFAWAVVAVPLAVMLHLVGTLFGQFIPLLGLWFYFIGSLLVCIGDPFIYILNRFFPALLNIADLSFINFRPMMFITYPD